MRARLAVADDRAPILRWDAIPLLEPGDGVEDVLHAHPLPRHAYESALLATVTLTRFVFAAAKRSTPPAGAMPHIAQSEGSRPVAHVMWTPRPGSGRASCGIAVQSLTDLHSYAGPGVGTPKCATFGFVFLVVLGLLGGWRRRRSATIRRVRGRVGVDGVGVGSEGHGGPRRRRWDRFDARWSLEVARDGHRENRRLEWTRCPFAPSFAGQASRALLDLHDIGAAVELT